MYKILKKIFFFKVNFWIYLSSRNTRFEGIGLLGKYLKGCEGCARCAFMPLCCASFGIDGSLWGNLKWHPAQNYTISTYCWISEYSAFIFMVFPYLRVLWMDFFVHWCWDTFMCENFYIHWYESLFPHSIFYPKIRYIYWSQNLVLSIQSRILRILKTILSDLVCWIEI